VPGSPGAGARPGRPGRDARAFYQRDERAVFVLGLKPPEVARLVRGEVDQLRRVHELLDELETLWRARLERFEDVLNETTGRERE